MFEFAKSRVMLVMASAMAIGQLARNGDLEGAKALARETAELLTIEPFGGNTVVERAASNLAGLVIGITIAAVVAVAVAIPVINDVVASANVTGTTATILDLLDLFIGLLILVAIAAPLMARA